MPAKPEVSIVIVKYRAEKQFQACLKSLKTTSTPHEIIVIDNNKTNRGYAKGNNLGASQAKCEYLLILNPDIQVFPGAVEKLVGFLDSHPETAIVAPLLLDPQKKPYPLQGTRKLTPISAIFSLSFINKSIPSNPVSYRYWIKDWDKIGPFSVDVIPGTAFLIRKQIFDQLGGFDENFFLYFEEADLCKRVKEQGWSIYMYPQAKIIHTWGASTSPSTQIQDIFNRSRKYYFHKHYGLLWATLVDWVCRFSPRKFLNINP